MRHNFLFDDINHALPHLMGALGRSPEFGSRAGITKEMMHVGISLEQPLKRELVLHSRKANVAAQIVETMWVLAGRNDIETLLPYLPRAADFSDDGETWRSGYGPRLRDFNGVDQLAYVVDTLKTNPHSRQAVINLWDPTVDTNPGKDVACNNWLSFSARHGALDLHVGIRSNDAMWGFSGINAFEWSVLLEVVAGMTGLEVGMLHFSTTSFHLYQQHWVKAERIAADTSGNPNVQDSPAFNPTGMDDVKSLDYCIEQWFALEAKIRTGRADWLEVVEFPEPMMRSWLRVLQWYWNGDEGFLDPLAGTRLHRACLVGLAPAGKTQEPAPVKSADDLHAEFLRSVNKLHAEKHAAYGDSWKRRGEPGILGNIARKVDRIGSGKDTTDETQADTAIDLMVYLAKYRCWLDSPDRGEPFDVEEVLARVEPYNAPLYLVEDFGYLEDAVANDYDKVVPIVDRMLAEAMTLAWSLWER